jgi:hypothetical protein
MTNPNLAFDTPEEAAMFGFPEKYCRIVASCAHGDDAYVLIDSGSDERPYLYGVYCSRKGGGWDEMGSSNGGGWSQAGPDLLLGTAVAWDEALPGAEAVRLEFEGVVQEVPVKAGAYLAAWWRVPCPNETGPRIDAYRINGEWIPVERSL